MRSYSRAIQEKLGEDVKHEVRSCTANPVEQSHRGIKHRYYPTLGFGEFGEREIPCYPKVSRKGIPLRIYPLGRRQAQTKAILLAAYNARVEAAHRFCQAVDEVK